MRSVTLPPIHSRSANGTALYEKRCPSCGKSSIVDKRKLGRPCIGCANRSRATHGLAPRGKMHPLYKVLKAMEARCRYPSATNYTYYGDRGITVCDEWRNEPGAFVAWAVQNGWRPGLEVDRIDPDGHYTPENCRLISHRLNSQRTRRIRTTPDQVAVVKRLLREGHDVRKAAAAARVTYMVAWHIRRSADVWANVPADECASK